MRSHLSALARSCLARGASVASSSQASRAVPTSQGLLVLTEGGPAAVLRGGLCASSRSTEAPALAFSLSRGFSAGGSAADQAKQVDTVNELFSAARDEIEYAQEESETVYFNDAVTEATAAVEKCLDAWKALLDSVSEDERHRLMRSMGMKIEQLKAEYENVKNLHLEDH